MRTEQTFADWRGLIADRSQAKRYFDPTHALDLVYGVDSDGRALMALLTDEPVEVEGLSKDVHVHKHTREDGRNVTTWSLLEKNLFDTFVTLCCDVVRRSADVSDRDRALQALLAGFAEWQLLLQPGRFKRLSLEALRGLVAELLVMTRELAPERGLPTVVGHWTGPVGGAQDFIFLTGELHEVKAKRVAGTSVRIASVEQLDPADDKNLTLHVLDLDERSPDTEGVVSLVTLVDEVRAGLSTNPTERLRFDRMLECLGVDLADAFYAETWFKQGGHRRFAVTSDFPSLRRNALQPHIVQVRYKLDTQHLTGWEIDVITTEEAPA